ncbi:MAG: helix-turn-helix domain-containing protein [Candidatus Pacearchaeota archaeon]
MFRYIRITFGKMTVIRPELVNKVKDYFNLNIYETKVWLALLSKGIATAGEIAEISGVPRSRTYDVLESLEKNGFAMQKIGKPVKYMAVKPINVIERLKKTTIDEMNEKLQVLSNIKDTKEYKELELLHSSKTDLIKNQDLSTTIRGRVNINSQLVEMFDSAKEEVIICASAQELRKRIKLLEPIIKRLLDSKVKLNIVLSGTDEEIKFISDKFGVKPMKITINSSFYIVDNSQILFMLHELNDSQEQIAVWFSSPFFVSSFTSLLNTAIKKSSTK